jgi:hypothetical protein
MSKGKRVRRDELIAALREIRVLLAREHNDFTWSGWQDADAALGEIDPIIVKLENDLAVDPGEISILFLPTGPIQEVSLSSGWGDEFLALAERVDRALGAR